jgi:hypothetical protein
VEAWSVGFAIQYSVRGVGNRPVLPVGPQAMQIEVSADGRDGVAIGRWQPIWWLSAAQPSPTWQQRMALSSPATAAGTCVSEAATRSPARRLEGAARTTR